MKLCKDCTHFSAGHCKHPRFGQHVDRVRGNHTKLWRACADQRANYPWWIAWVAGFNRCGPEGRYFEGKRVPLTGPARLQAVREGKPDYVVLGDEDMP